MVNLYAAFEIKLESYPINQASYILIDGEIGAPTKLSRREPGCNGYNVISMFTRIVERKRRTSVGKEEVTLWELRAKLLREGSKPCLSFAVARVNSVEILCERIN